MTVLVSDTSNLAIEVEGMLGSSSIYLDGVLSDTSTQQVRRFGVLIDGIRDRSVGRG